MQLGELLTLIGAAGIQLRRLPGDKIEAVGQTDERIRSGMKECYQELLAVVPEPAAFDFRKLRSESIDDANSLVPVDAFPTAADWAAFDAADDAFDAAVDANDIPGARAAAAAYVGVAERINLRDTGFKMTGNVQFAAPKRHRLDKSTPAPPPLPPVCPACGFDMSPACRAGTCRGKPEPNHCTRCHAPLGTDGTCTTCGEW